MSGANSLKSYPSPCAPYLARLALQARNAKRLQALSRQHLLGNVARSKAVPDVASVLGAELPQCGLKVGQPERLKPLAQVVSGGVGGRDDGRLRRVGGGGRLQWASGGGGTSTVCSGSWRCRLALWVRAECHTGPATFLHFFPLCPSLQCALHHNPTHVLSMILSRRKGHTEEERKKRQKHKRKRNKPKNNRVCVVCIAGAHKIIVQR